jgi:hypothetical protein
VTKAEDQEAEVIAAQPLRDVGIDLVVEQEKLVWRLFLKARPIYNNQRAHSKS